MSRNRKLIAGLLVIFALISLNYLTYFSGDREWGSTQEQSEKDSRLDRSGALGDDFYSDLRSRKRYELESNLFVAGRSNAMHVRPEPEPVQKITQEPEVSPVQAQDISLRVVAITKHANGTSALVEYGDQIFSVKRGDLIGSKYKVKSIINMQITLELQGVE